MPDFVPTFWNTLTQFNGKSRTSKVSAGQVAYKKRGYAWDNIVTDIESNGGATFTATKFPGHIDFPRNAQDWLEAEFNGEYSAKRQITEGNWQNSEDPFAMRMRADCPTTATGIIHPDKPWQVIYYNAFGQGQNLIYGHWHGKTSRLEHVVEITEMPAGDSEYLTYDFYIESEDATTFVGENFDQRPWDGNSGDGATVQGFSVFLAKGSDPSTIRGAILRKPVCWWANLDGTTTIKDVRVDVVIQPDRKTVKATKYILRTDIAAALAQGSPYRADVTFLPDPNPETSSVDGYTGNNNVYGSWSTLMAASATLTLDNSTTLPQTIRDGGADVYRDFNRPITLFDTSSIGVDQVVTAATQEMTISSVNAGTSWDGINLNVYGISPASNTAIVTADHLTMTRTPLDAGVQWGGLRTTGSGAVASFVFDATGRATVNTTGISKYAIGWAYEASDTTPAIDMSGTTGPLWHSAEAAGTANDPALIVTHSAAGPAVPVLAHHKKLSLRY